MITAEVKVGVICNNNCKFCLNDARDWELGTKTIKFEIDHYIRAGVQSITFTGGEVTIRKDFFEILDYALRKCQTVIIQTNGRSLSYQKIAQALKSKPIYLLISLHAHTPELYKKISRTDGYHQVMKGIKNLKQAGLKFGINTVVCDENIHEIPDIIEHHSKINPEMIQLSWIRPQGKAKKSSLIPFSPENLEKLKKAIDYLIENNQKFGLISIPPCILPEYDQYKRDPYHNMKIKTSESIESAEHIIKRRKRYTTKCHPCRLKHLCEGIYKEYPIEFEKYLNPVN